MSKLEKQLRDIWQTHTEGEFVNAMEDIIKEYQLEHGKALFDAIKEVWEKPPQIATQKGADLMHWDRHSIIDSLQILRTAYEEDPFEVAKSNKGKQ